jgi:hypothetical protein
LKEMTHPNSIDEKHIETFLMVRKQRRYSRLRNSLSKDIYPNMLQFWHEKRQGHFSPCLSFFQKSLLHRGGNSSIIFDFRLL